MLVIYTGDPNPKDLHSPHKDRERWRSRPVGSSLTPALWWTDTLPHVIHDIDMEIRGGCPTLANVHLALLPVISS